MCKYVFFLNYLVILSFLLFFYFSSEARICCHTFPKKIFKKRTRRNQSISAYNDDCEDDNEMEKRTKGC